MTTTAPRGLVPPRPNLGPEPWSEPRSIPAAAMAVLVLILFVIASAVLYAIWRRRRRARAAKAKSQPAERADATARERLIGLSGSLRGALVGRFGPTYRARTIEELCVDSQLGELLGGERIEQLVRFLLQVDQLKFAPERAPRDQEALQVELADWAPRVEMLMSQIRAKGSVNGKQKQAKRGRGRAERV